MNMPKPKKRTTSPWARRKDTPPEPADVQEAVDAAVDAKPAEPDSIEAGPLGVFELPDSKAVIQALEKLEEDLASTMESSGIQETPLNKLWVLNSLMALKECALSARMMNEAGADLDEAISNFQMLSDGMRKACRRSFMEVTQRAKGALMEMPPPSGPEEAPEAPKPSEGE